MNNRHKWRHEVDMRLQSMDTQAALNFIRESIKHLPEVVEKTCYGTPGFYAKNKLFARLKEDCQTLVIQTFDRHEWIGKDPETFFVTDHYLNHDYMLINLNKVSPDDLKHLLEIAWRNRASAKLLKEYEAMNSGNQL